MRASSFIGPALVAGLPIGLAVLLSEAIAGAVGTAQPVRNASLLVLYLSALGLAVSFAAGVAMLALRRSQATGLLETVPSKLVVFSVMLVGVYAVHRGADGFHNRELTALLVAVATLIVLGAGLAVNFAVSHTLSWLARRRDWSPARAGWVRWVLAGAITVVCAAALAWQNRDGFAQLNLALLVTPVVALFATGVAWARPARFQIGGYPLGLAIALVAGVAWTTGALAPHLPRDLASSGNWSAWLLRLGHAATDFDGDGYSSLMGGGDCRAFDATFHPGAEDLPNDGIDSNCSGADGVVFARRAPVWEELPAYERFNIVLISIEALRPDRLSLMGYERDTTPSLKRIAEDSVVFERAYSPSTLTRWVLPSVFSSLSPSRVPFDKNQVARGKKRLRVAEQTPWLPSMLREAGYHTAAVQTDFKTFSASEGLGLERGFDSYDATTRLKYSGGTMQGFPGEKQVRRAQRALTEAKAPFFLWVHLVEPHYRYERHESAPDFGRSEGDRYDAEVWLADSHVGVLYDQLREAGLWDSTIFIVMGDHGEEFKEHGKRFHGSNLFDPQVRTLLMMHVPGMEPRRVDEPVLLNELPATLLNLTGIRESFAQLESSNLVPLLRGMQDPQRPPLVLELFTGFSHKEYQAAVIDWPYKVLFSEVGGTFTAFDLAADPSEENELTGDPGDLKALKEWLAGYLESSAKHSGESRAVVARRAIVKRDAGK